MRLRLLSLLLLSGWTLSGRVHAHYALPETEKVPIDRLFANLQQRLVRKTNDFELTYQLARLHSMAYATNLVEVKVIKKSGNPHWWETRFSGIPKSVQAFKSPEARKVGLQHLANAIALHERTLALLRISTNAYAGQIIHSQLGLAWCLDQSGQKDKALEAYRKALKTGWHMEVTGDFNFKQWVNDIWDDVKAHRNPIHSRQRGFIMSGECYCEEIIGYMLKLLDPVKDAKEVADLNQRKKILNSMDRAITPIFVALENSPFAELVNPNAGVNFDLDGSGSPRKWGWITPKAAWLVFDSDGSGQITSALQMFGNVTFWIFWRDGYAALAALDDDGDGVLRGSELRGLALWRDANGNGVSDPGEVQPVEAWGITAIACKSQTHSTGIQWNPLGLTITNGTSRATYDWIAPSK